MSSRFLKKVSETYGTKFEAPESELLDNEDVHDHINKFSLLQIESESDAENDQITEVCTENASIKKKSKVPKTKSNKKRHQHKESAFQEMTEDEILEQFHNASLETSEVHQETTNAVRDSLSIKLRNLNENIELQQMFGPGVANVNTPNDRNRRHNNHLSTLKCTFGKRGVDWPQLSLSKLGLKMDRVDLDSGSQGNWCIVTCNDDYLRGERALKVAMTTGAFQDLLRDRPYHVNTLLQMAALLTNQEDFTMAADLLKRVFYVYETVSPMGLSLLGLGGVASGGAMMRSNCCLDYRYRMNRGVFLALFQWVLYLCRRSCFTTALEYCKVLLSLNVEHDPLAIILLIDDIALRANQLDWVLQFHTEFSACKSLLHLPNYALSVALCLFLQSSSSPQCLQEADERLQTALSRFPAFLTALIDHCGIRADERLLRSSFFNCSSASNSATDGTPLSVLIGLYAKRSINLWKEAAVLRWVERNVQVLLDRLEDAADQKAGIELERDKTVAIYKKRAVPLAVRRHVLLSGHAELLGSRHNNLGDGQAASSLIFDPFPPSNGEGGFDHYGGGGEGDDARSDLDDSWLMNLFRSLLPSFR